MFRSNQQKQPGICCSAASVRWLRLWTETSRRGVTRSHGGCQHALAWQRREMLLKKHRSACGSFQSSAARCLGWTASCFGYWDEVLNFWESFWKQCSRILAVWCQLPRAVPLPVTTQLSNHSVVAIISHLEMILILHTRCIGSYGIHVCQRIVRPALTCKTTRKTVCFAHLLSDTTVTLNHWKRNMFIIAADPSFLLKWNLLAGMSSVL